MASWSKDDDPEDAGFTKSCSLVGLHVFSDKYSISRLAQETMNAYYSHMCDDMADLATPTVINFAYKSLHEDAPLCRFLSHIQCTVESPTWDQTRCRDWPPVFLFSVLRRYAGIVNNRVSKSHKKLVLCDYDDHTTDEEKEASKKEQK